MRLRTRGWPLRSHTVYLVVLASVAVSGLVASMLTGDIRTSSASAFYFLVALSVLGMFDVWLPRGDYLEMGGAIALATALSLGPPRAAVVITASRLLVLALRRLDERPWLVVEDVSRRVMLASLAFGTFGLVGGELGPRAIVGSAGVPRILVVALVYFALDMFVKQLSSSLRLGTPYGSLLIGNLRLQGWLGIAQVSAAVLAVLTYRTMGPFGLAIVAGLLLVMRQSFSLLIDVKHAYRSTVEALARAIEAHDPQRRGHAERVGCLAAEAGRLLGLHGRQLEALTYAALFHDVGRLDVDEPAAARTGSAAVLENVGFLGLAVPILRIIDARGAVESSQTEGDLVAAYAIASMSEYDERRNGIPLAEPDGVARAIGSRLYADTRHAVDKAIRRVELRAEAGRMTDMRAIAEESC